MVRQYTRDSVETHSLHYYGPELPAVNVKAGNYRWPIAEHFQCSDEVAEQAARFAFEMQQALFWEEAPDMARECLGPGLEVYSAGRCGGWLVVQGLPPLDQWDAVRLARWRKFEHRVKREVEYLTAWDNVRELIDVNRWAETGAERYNFTNANGAAQCLVDLKQGAKAAGFGPVVRN